MDGIDVHPDRLQDKVEVEEKKPGHQGQESSIRGRHPDPGDLDPIDTLMLWETAFPVPGKNPYLISSPLKGKGFLLDPEIRLEGVC